MSPEPVAWPRPLPGDADLIELGATDVNKGNSGNPIVDAASGLVVGIATSSLHGDHIEGVHFGISLQDALRELGIRAVH